MGIRGLTSLIKKHVPDALQNYNISYFNGSRIAIDTSILLYKFRYTQRNDNAHISGFLNKCFTYVRHGIIPVFIIDGKPPPEKSNCIQKRYRHRQKLEKQIEELKEKIGNPGENARDIISKISKLDKQIITVTREHHEETRELLSLLGFKVIQSPGEAEETCVYLQKNDIVNFTYSDDTDVLPLGCPRVLRTGLRSNCFTEIDLQKVLTGLGLTLDQFIDMCILCGCDYCPVIPRVNYQRAYELITQFKTIENVIASNTDKLPNDYNFQDARNIFKNNKSRMEVPLGDYVPHINEIGLYRFLTKRKYSKRYISRYIDKFKQAIQTKLGPSRSNDEYCLSYFVPR